MPIAARPSNIIMVQGERSTAQSINKGKAASIAKFAYGGKVLSVKKRVLNHQTLFRVKLLEAQSGRIKIVVVDGQGNIKKHKNIH